MFSLPLESKKPMKLEDVPLVRIKLRLSSSEWKTDYPVDMTIINETYISGSSFFFYETFLNNGALSLVVYVEMNVVGYNFFFFKNGFL